MRRHRIRTVGSMLPLAALVLPLALGTQTLADESPLPSDTYCGSDVLFSVRGPEGWEKVTFEKNGFETLRFQPRSKLFGPGVEIMVTTPGDSGSHHPVDLEDTIVHWVSLEMLTGSVDEARDVQISHPRYATRSAELHEGRGAPGDDGA